jgi:hypothetical protein
MHTDIYLTIGLYLPIPSILNYLLAKKVNREYFWKLRLEQDYSLNNPLNLSYSLLYKLHYEYTPGKSTWYETNMPTGFSSHSHFATKITPFQLLNALPTKPLEGQIIRSREISIHGFERLDYYIFDSGNLIEIGCNVNLSRKFIPAHVSLINKYPIHYFQILAGRYLNYKLDLTLYLPQIQTNNCKNNEYLTRSSYRRKSYFITWRGERIDIYYKKLSDILNKDRIYRIENDRNSIYSYADYV